MKKFFSILAMALMALVNFSSCIEEESMDTMVEWGFAKDEASNIDNYNAITYENAATILTAFDETFIKEYTKVTDGHRVMMTAQSSKSSATKNAKKTAEKALASLSGITSTHPSIFVVRIKYDSDTYETVWSHDFKAKK